MEYPPTRGGAGVYCEEIANATNELGGNVEVLAPKGSISESSVRLIQLAFNGSQNWGCSWKIYKFLESQSLSNITLHIGDPGALRAMIRFGWLLQKPAKLIITVHGSEIPKFSRNSIERLFFKNLLKKADKIHVLSKYNEDKLVQFCRDIKNRVQLIPGAPARDILPKSNPLGTRDYSNKDLVLLCVGRIHPRKGQYELLHAVEKLPSELKKRLTCWFVGPKTKVWYAKKIIEKSNQIGCDVKFLGDLKNKDLRAAYQNADIFALTSKLLPNSVEGFGFVYLEASAYGLPILANRVGGVGDAVISGKTGLLCDPGMPNDLEIKLRKLIEEPKIRQSFGKAGVEWSNKHNWTTTAQKLYELP